MASKPASKTLMALMLQALASGPVLVSALPEALGRNAREVQRARVALVSSGRVAIQGDGEQAMLTLGSVGPEEEAREEARAAQDHRPGPALAGPEEARPSRALLPKSQQLNEQEKAAAAGPRRGPGRPDKEARAARKRPGPVARALDLVGDLSARLEEACEREAAQRARVAFLEGLLLGRRDAKPPNGPGNPRVSPEKNETLEAACRATTPTGSPSAPRPSKSSSPTGGASTEPARSSAPAPSSSSSSSASGARSVSAPSASPSRSQGSTPPASSRPPSSARSEVESSTPEEIQEAAEEELETHERKKGSKVENREPWLAPKLRELALDRPRVLRALAKRRARLLEDERSAREAVAGAERRAREEAERSERRESVESERDRRRRLGEVLKALDPDRRADLATQASERLIERGVRPGSLGWEARHLGEVYELMEPVKGAVACP